MQDLSAIPVFLAVIEEQSFSRAAEKLGITTSAVSKRVSALEAQIGIKLVNRTTRRVSLTESGMRYFQYAQQAVMAAEDAENAAREEKDVPSGLLRISSPISFGTRQLAELIPPFLQENPRVSVQITLNDAFDKVNIEDYDVILSSGAMPSGSFKSVILREMGGLVCAAPEYLDKHGSPKEPEDLLNFNCLLNSFHQIADEWVFKKHGEEIKVKIMGNYRCNSPDAVYKTALHGLGIACLPSYIVTEDINRGTLVPLLQSYAIEPRIFKAVYPDIRYLPAKVKVFIEYLQQNT